MSDVEEADDDIIENPNPESDFRVEEVSDNESYADNIESAGLACARDSIDDASTIRISDDNPSEVAQVESALNHAVEEDGQLPGGEDVQAVSNEILHENNQASGGRTLEDNHEGHEYNGSLDRNEVEQIVGDESSLVAEDEQYLGHEVSNQEAEWSLEPEENSQNFESYTNGNDGTFSGDAVESDQMDNYSGNRQTDRTESSSMLALDDDDDDDDDNTEGESGPSHSNVSSIPEDIQCTADQGNAEENVASKGVGSNADVCGPSQELLSAAEEDRLLQLESEPTEADQEIQFDSGSGFDCESSTQNPESVVVNDRCSHAMVNLDNIGSRNARQVPEDEIGSLTQSDSASIVTSESYQPECDQTSVKGNESNISGNCEAAEVFQSTENKLSAVPETGNCAIENNENLSNHLDAGTLSERSLLSVNKRADTETDCDSQSVPNQTCEISGTGSNKCDNDAGSQSDNALNVSESKLTVDKGAIPKHKPSNHSDSESKHLRLNNQSQACLQNCDSNTVSLTNSLSHQPSPVGSLTNEIEDAEDALLSELDATLQADSSASPRKTNMKKIVQEDETENHLIDKSCDQRKQNNLQCSLALSRGDNHNIPELKEVKRQLHQAKNLLLERECEISRLKEDLDEKSERYNTLVLERDSCSKELECLRAQNSDDLYIPQIKELEYTITQQQNEIRSWKDKLASHDGAAKRAISTLQNEMKLRLDQMTKTCEEANKEKDSMVVKYAQAEHKNLEFQKQAERAEAKLKEMEKERDAFLVKMRAVKEQRTKLGAEVEAKNVEISNLNKELDKQRETISSADVRVKWAQNKLKSELDAHKETKTQLEKMTVKLKEAKEETQQIRADCQAIIKTYQESEEVKSNSLDKELKLKETELLANLQEKTNWELAHVKTQRELEVVKAELIDSKAQCVNLTDKLSSLEGNLSQSNGTVEKYGEIIQKQKKEIQDLRERIETLVQYRTDFTRSQELIKTLDIEIAELKISNKDLLAEMEACKKREMDKLELTEKLTQKNVELQSENTTLGNKVLTLTGELQSIKMEYQGTDVKIKDLTESLNIEQKLRQEETQSLNTKLAGKCKAVEDLTRKLEEEKDEIKTLKRKHTNNIRDLTRQLQLVRRKLETQEASTNGDKDAVSMGSRTSSNGSLNISEQPTAQVVQPNSAGGGQISNSIQNHSTPEQEYPVITEQVEVDKQVLIERIVKLQRALARKNEKLEFMEDHISQLVDEIQKKNKIIQSYILKEESGTMTSDFRDRTKAEISRKHSIMGSVYSSHSNDGSMNLDLSLEINRKLQAVLEDTLLKNMTLKDSIDTLGQEIARLSQENRQLQLKLQGLNKSRTKGNPAVR